MAKDRWEKKAQKLEQAENPQPEKLKKGMFSKMIDTLSGKRKLEKAYMEINNMTEDDFLREERDIMIEARRLAKGARVDTIDEALDIIQALNNDYLRLRNAGQTKAAEKIQDIKAQVEANAETAKAIPDEFADFFDPEPQVTAETTDTIAATKNKEETDIMSDETAAAREQEAREVLGDDYDDLTAEWTKAELDAKEEESKGVLSDEELARIKAEDERFIDYGEELPSTMVDEAYKKETVPHEEAAAREQKQRFDMFNEKALEGVDTTKPFHFGSKDFAPGEVYTVTDPKGDSMSFMVVGFDKNRNHMITTGHTKAELVPWTPSVLQDIEDGVASSGWKMEKHASATEATSTEEIQARLTSLDTPTAVSETVEKMNEEPPTVAEAPAEVEHEVDDADIEDVTFENLSEEEIQTALMGLDAAEKRNIFENLSEDEIDQALSTLDSADKRNLFENLSEDEIEQALAALDESDRRNLFADLSEDEVNGVLQSLDAADKQNLFEHLSEEEINALLAEMDAADKINIFENLSEKEIDSVLSQLDIADKRNLFAGLSDSEIDNALATLDIAEKKNLFDTMSDEEINRALAGLDQAEKKNIFADITEEEIDQALVGLDVADKKNLFADLSDEEMSTLLGSLDEAEKRNIFEHLSEEEIDQALAGLDLAEKRSLFADLGDEEIDQALSGLDSADKRSIFENLSEEEINDALKTLDVSKQPTTPAVSMRGSAVNTLGRTRKTPVVAKVPADVEHEVADEDIVESKELADETFDAEIDNAIDNATAEGFHKIPLKRKEIKQQKEAFPDEWATDDFTIEPTADTVATTDETTTPEQGQEAPAVSMRGSAVNTLGRTREKPVLAESPVDADSEYEELTEDDIEDITEQVNTQEQANQKMRESIKEKARMSQKRAQKEVLRTQQESGTLPAELSEQEADLLQEMRNEEIDATLDNAKAAAEKEENANKALEQAVADEVDDDGVWMGRKEDKAPVIQMPTSRVKRPVQKPSRAANSDDVAKAS